MKETAISFSIQPVKNVYGRVAAFALVMHHYPLGASAPRYQREVARLDEPTMREAGLPTAIKFKKKDGNT